MQICLLVSVGSVSAAAVLIVLMIHDMIRERWATGAELEMFLLKKWSTSFHRIAFKSPLASVFL